MSIRSKSRRPRCRTCGLHLELCLCAEAPQLDNATEVVVVQHAVERRKPTSTTPLLLHVLANKSLLIHGATDQRFAAEALDDDVGSVLLYPDPDATDLATLPPTPRRRRLIVLDGTWSQCARMARRIPELRRLTRVALPPGPPSNWSLRRNQSADRLCTLEATMRALAILEDPLDVEPVLSHFHKVTARALYMRARLPAPEIPDSWQTPET